MKRVLDSNRSPHLGSRNAINRRSWQQMSLAEFGQMLDGEHDLHLIQSLRKEIGAAVNAMHDQLGDSEAAVLNARDPFWRGRLKQALRYTTEKYTMIKAAFRREEAYQQERNKTPEAVANWKKFAMWNRWHVFRAIESIESGNLDEALRVLKACREGEVVEGAPKYDHNWRSTEAK